MPRQFRPGVFTELFTAMAARAEVATGLMLTGLGSACEEQAKHNLAQASHAHGTRTPAHPGGPPARISGTLHDSVGHTEPHRTPSGWQVRVGPEDGHTPPYARHHATPSSRYGQYLETRLRNGATYPWLKPAFEHTVHTGVAKAAQALAAALRA